jgi:CRP-like cAMP-binding protein
MTEVIPRKGVSNHILRQLSASDFALLVPYLRAVDLPARKVLEARNKTIESIYFIESGIASVVANGSDKQGIEVGIIGREGMTGVSVLLDADRPPCDTFIQIPGNGLCLKAQELRTAIDQSVSLHRAMLRFAHSFMAQITSTALANGRSKIEERLARWLLMAEDRVGSELPLTHEFLALMLGVQRSGVTIALHALEKNGLISTRRGKITVLDRPAMEHSSNGTYVPSTDLPPPRL